MRAHFPTAQQENSRFLDTTGRARGEGRRATPEDGTIAVSDAKRKIYAKRLILVSALLLIIFGIIATYLGAANLYRYIWWSGHYEGDYTDTGMWTQEAVRSYLIWGFFFVITGVLGIVCGFLLFFWGLPAVAEDNRPFLRKILLPIGILGIIPSPGLVVVGVLLLMVWQTYANERYDLFGLLLEDVSAIRRPMPGVPTPVATPSSRDMYATGYQEQRSLYSDDYAQSTYGGGEWGRPEPQEPQEPKSLLETEYAEPAMPAPAPQAPAGPPMCSSCGKPTEWIEEYGRYYCYDCDMYV